MIIDTVLSFAYNHLRGVHLFDQAKFLDSVVFQCSTILCLFVITVFFSILFVLRLIRFFLRFFIIKEKREKLEE